MEKLEEKVYCRTCKRKNFHEIITTYKEQSDNSKEDFHWHALYYIVRCSGCHTVAFVEQYGDEDTWEYIDGDREWYDTFKVYPEEPPIGIIEGVLMNIYTKKKRSYPNVPKHLNELYSQIIDSFNNEQDILSVAGLRILVEGMCIDSGIKKGNLYKEDGSKVVDSQTGEEVISKRLAGKIFGLYENGYIIFTKALLLQKIRLIGNDAVHEITPPDRSTIYHILFIVEKIMEDIYELKFHKLLKKD